MIYFIIADTNFGSHVEQISTDFNKLREYLHFIQRFECRAIRGITYA